MDHIRALNQLRSLPTLSLALTHAIYDRRNSDHFCDFIEIEDAERNRRRFLRELMEELAQPTQYTPRPAFAYFPPKNDLCDRRLIYLPLKDLTVRFAFAQIFSDEIEMEIHPECFANRRATGAEAAVKLTEDFATGGWANFCSWQQSQSGNNSVLLRTDISSFYDSVSHEYLVDAVCRHLVLPPDCELVALFRRIIRVPVIHYSPATGEIEGPHRTDQGLPLGDGVEGYLANLYLKDVDDAMIHTGANYGRYVDDIRIFGRSRTEVIQRLRVLQEQLLRKGLNLNSSKTAIAEDPVSQAQMVSRLYAEGEYEVENESAGSVIASQIDAPLEQFDRHFAETDELEEGKDAKDFCRFLSAHTAEGDPLVPLDARRAWHVERLRDAIVRWRGPTKHAAWLLVQTATYRGINHTARTRARSVIFELFGDSNTNSYAKYRLTHHLIKLRQGRAPQPFRLFDQLSVSQRRQTVLIWESWLGAPAFELNLIALYALSVQGTSVADLRRLAGGSRRHISVPIRNALTALSASMPTEVSPASNAPENEPDESPGPY